MPRWPFVVSFVAALAIVSVFVVRTLWFAMLDWRADREQRENEE